MKKSNLYSDYKLNSIHIIESTDENKILSRGTCFAISSTFIVTAYHVIKDSFKNELFITYDNYIKRDAIKLELVQEIAEFDIAILKIVNQDIVLSPIGVCESIPLDIELQINLCGYPSEKKSQATLSTSISEDLSNVDTNKYSVELLKKINVTNYKGMSGSPILKGGYAIGILLVQSGGSLLYGVSFNDIFSAYSYLKQEFNFQVSYYDEVLFTPMPFPETPLNITFVEESSYPKINGLEIGFTLDNWDDSDLLECSYEWLVDYSLTASQKMIYEQKPKPFEMLKNAVSFFDIASPNSLSNLLLHMAIRKHYKTIPVVNSVSTLNQDSIFSCSHVVLNNGLFEIWLGVSFIDNDLEYTIKKVKEILNQLLHGNEIKERLILINNQTDPRWPFKDRIDKLGDNNINIKDRVDKIVIPVFISHKSNAIINYDENNFEQLFREEVLLCKQHFKKEYPNVHRSFEVKLFHFPSKCTETLINDFNQLIAPRK